LHRYLATNPGVAATLEAFVQQPTGIATPLAALGSDTALLPPLAQGEATLLPNATTRLLLRRGGGYEYHGRSGTDPAATVTTFDADALRVVPREPRQTFTYDFVQLAPGEQPVQVLAQHATIEEVWRRHFVGDRYSLWSVTETTRTTYPGHPGIAPRDAERTGVMHAFRLHQLSQRFWHADVIDRRVLPHFCLAADSVDTPDRLRECEYAQTTFIRDGSGLVQELGAKVDPNLQPVLNGFATQFFAWTLGPRGALQVRFPGTDVTYWRLEGGNPTVAPVVYLARKQGPDGRTHSLAGMSVLMDARGGAGIDQVSAQGRWSYGTFVQNANPDPWPAPPVENTFERLPDGITRQVVRYPGTERPTSTSRASWQLVDIDIYFQAYTRLYERRYRGNNGLFPSCAEAYENGASECIPLQARYFRPMAEVGDRIYGIEELYVNTGWFGEAPLLTRHVRPTYHERIAGADIVPPPRLPTTKVALRRMQ